MYGVVLLITLNKRGEKNPIILIKCSQKKNVPCIFYCLAL